MTYQQNSNSATVSKIRTIAYWVTTAIIVLETGVGAWWDIMKIPFVSNVMHNLGYPLYILSIIGFWKVFAVVALLIPGFPRVKEWAYAGVFFVYTSAAASHLAMGDVSAAWGPAVFACITFASRALRPSSRRLKPTQIFDGKIDDESAATKKWKAIAYWTIIVILEFVLLSAGIAELMHFSANVEGIVNQLGYPMYFLTIQGVWKILGGIALLMPRFPVLKEWAYAGIIFNMTGAVASSAICGLGAGHLIAPLIIAGIAVTSWVLRPPLQKFA